MLWSDPLMSNFYLQLGYSTNRTVSYGIKASLQLWSPVHSQPNQENGIIWFQSKIFSNILLFCKQNKYVLIAGWMLSSAMSYYTFYQGQKYNSRHWWSRRIKFQSYRKISYIRRIKSQNSNDSRLVLQLSLPNSLKPCVKSRMKMNYTWIMNNFIAY